MRVYLILSRPASWH